VLVMLVTDLSFSYLNVAVQLFNSELEFLD
jgi:hypothetical protein